MKKIHIHILRIEKWKQDLENETILNNNEIKKINEESENLEQSNNDISKIPTLS